MSPFTTSPSPKERAEFLRSRLPSGGLFAGQEWRISPDPFLLTPPLVEELRQLGRMLLQFYKTSDLLYRKSAAGKLPSWIATLLDQGKPEWLVQLQRNPAFKQQVPRVIRPDIILVEEGFSITELDSVPGGVGLIGWLNQSYDLLAQEAEKTTISDPDAASPETAAVETLWQRSPIGGRSGPVNGFRNIFDASRRIHIVVSEESASYRPEMEWLAAQVSAAESLDNSCAVRTSNFDEFGKGDAVYRFFELFDLKSVPNAGRIFDLAVRKSISLTPPPKYVFEEKMLFALLWNRNLRDFWRQELGEGFFRKLQTRIPYTWTVDPTPLPPHAAYPELGLTDWRQLKNLSQKDRRLILKISGFAPEAWGARGVHLGSDLSAEDWSRIVEQAIHLFAKNPYILQRFTKPKIVKSRWMDFKDGTLQPMTGRARLCPYYFVNGEKDIAKAELSGCLATICPTDKKILHGMRDAILAPCAV